MSGEIDFKSKAHELATQGIAAVPLRLNDQGIAKIPIPTAWQLTTVSDVEGLDWSRAEGIGTVLGANSGNRAAIDIDDKGLAADTFGLLVRDHSYPLMTITASGHLHVHVVEPSPSPSTVLRVVYQGRQIGVELKATGNQVVVPPTPKYAWVNEAWEPLYGSVADVWARIARRLGVTADGSASARGAAGYPSPFQSFVAKGERNNAMFIESCRLADAGVPFDKAMNFMLKRIAKSYEQGGLRQREVWLTVRSAYKRAGTA